MSPTRKPALAFDLVGGWTSPWLFVRLLTIVDGDWEPLQTGFVHRGTKEKALLTMGPPVPTLSGEAFALGVDPFAPTIDEDLLDEIETHKAVVTIRSTNDARPALDRALTVVRATNAALNAGATAVRCRTSGLAHSSDGFQLLAAAVEAAVPQGRDALAEALVGAYVLFGLPSTRGLHALGVPDLAVEGTGDRDRDLARLRTAAVALARGADPGTPRPDDRGLPAPMVNPFGLVDR